MGEFLILIKDKDRSQKHQHQTMHSYLLPTYSHIVSSVALGRHLTIGIGTQLYRGCERTPLELKWN